MRQHESDIRPERAASPRHRTHRRASRLAVIAFGALVALGACSSGAKTATAGQSAAPGSGAQAQGADTPAAGGENAAAGEPAAVAFTHPTLGYRIDAPGGMTASGDGASYKGTTDFLNIAVVTGSNDPAALAHADASGSGIQNFQLIVAAHDVTVNGLKGSALEFTEPAGTSPVTGKALIAHVVRTYLPRTGGAYRIEYVSTVSSANWDPQGAMDIIATFKTGP
jgi:hypothetical protein